jgi:hypothetical protein
MSTIPRRSVVLTATLASAALLGQPASGEAQTTPPAPDVLAALLVEVRGLRAAMEQMASAGPRVQLALGRLQLQEQRVNTMLRRLEEVRTALTPARSASDDFSGRLARLERAARTSTNEEQRKEAEEAVPQIRAEAQRAAAEVHRLQTEESTLLQDIAGEQNRWTELNQRLEELERSLDRRQK